MRARRLLALRRSPVPRSRRCRRRQRARSKLHRCDLGAAAAAALRQRRRCRCAARTRRSARPRIAFAVRPRGDRSRPSLGTRRRRRRRPRLQLDRGALRALGRPPCWRRCCAAASSSSSTSAAPALGARSICRALQRGLVPEYIAIGQCAEQLGPRYAAYTTAEAAADIDAVRSALGLGRAFLYGDSYGTLLGQAYAVRYPQRLRGLILDSAYPGRRSLLPDPLPGGHPRPADRLPPLADLLGRPGRALPPRGPALPRRRALDRGPALVPARRGHPGAALLPQPRRRRPPLPARRARAGSNRLLDGESAGHGEPARILLRDGDRDRVQRLPAALGSRARRWKSGSASSSARSAACRGTTSRPSAAPSTCSPRPRT